MTQPELLKHTRPLGRRQREVLAQMTQNGGVWPVGWRIKYAHQPVFDSLLSRGLIVRDGNRYRVVTR